MFSSIQQRTAQHCELRVDPVYCVWNDLWKSQQREAEVWKPQKSVSSALLHKISPSSGSLLSLLICSSLNSLEFPVMLNEPLLKQCRSLILNQLLNTCKAPNSACCHPVDTIFPVLRYPILAWLLGLKVESKNTILQHLLTFFGIETR